MTPLIGHHANQRQFLAAIRSGKMHHGWILAGPQGLGKHLFARHAATQLLGSNAPPESDLFDTDILPGPQRQMIDAKTHPDCHELEREAKNDTERKKQEKGQVYECRRNIRIDQVRALQRRFVTRPSLSDQRVIIIDAVDDLERNAANALLKSLEEPPRNTVFLLISHSPGRLLPTIRSRCLMMRFHPLPPEQMQQVIALMQPDLPAEQTRALLDTAGGIPGRINGLLDADVATLVEAVHAILDQGDHDHRHRLTLASLLAGKGAVDRVGAFLSRLPKILADHARRSKGAQRMACISARSEIEQLASELPRYNYDPQALVFRIGGLLASVAATRDG
ncbi:MAG: AAA family ATPase [Pseudomonadota bacterium]